MKFTYKATFRAACTGYVVQAIVNNLAPLLFIAFQDCLGLNRLQITTIITANFLLQLLVDLVSVRMIDRIGYCAAAVLASVLVAVPPVEQAYADTRQELQEQLSAAEQKALFSAFPTVCRGIELLLQGKTDEAMQACNGFRPEVGA